MLLWPTWNLHDSIQHNQTCQICVVLGKEICGWTYKPEHPVFINVMHSAQKYAQNLKLQ